MSDEHLKREPHAIKGTDEAWWYEEPTGITIVTEHRDPPNCEPKGRYIDTSHYSIPWARVRAAIARKDRP